MVGRVAPLIIIPPNSFYVYEKSPWERSTFDPPPPLPQLLASCNHTIRPDCRLKVIIDQGVRMAHGRPMMVCTVQRPPPFSPSVVCRKQCSWVENPSDLTGPLSTNTKGVFGALDHSVHLCLTRGITSTQIFLCIRLQFFFLLLPDKQSCKGLKMLSFCVCFFYFQ